MKLFLIFLASLSGFSYGNEIGPSLERISARTANCGVPGVNTPTKCVSETEFIFNQEDIATAIPIRCPLGMVCADVPGACAAGVTPACENFCDECSTCRSQSHLACISPTAYTACVNGKPLMGFERECAAPLRYCKIIAVPGAPLVTCIAQAVDADCKALPFHQQLQDASEISD